jgi:hypothetical protein
LKQLILYFFETEREEIEPLRPSFAKETEIDDELKNIITQCWEEDEEARPTFSQLSFGSELDSCS